MRSPAVRTFACFALAASCAAAAPALCASEDLTPLLDRLSYETPDGPYAWTRGTAPLSPGGSRALRVSVGGVMAAPGAAPLNLKREFQARDYEVTLTRDWPAAVRYDDGVVEFDVTPHAGVGFTNLGGLAEAGATVRLSRSRDRDERARQELARLGVGDGPSAFGDRGRWYLFAAASGRAVGLNMLRDDSGWRRAGWTTDPSSALVGDAQLGVGWRRGAWQTSVGYVHREVKGDHMVFGQQTKEDSLAAFTLSFRPH